MARARTNGAYTVTSAGRTYHYAWRGGPRVHGEPGTPAFEIELKRLQRERSEGGVTETLSDLVGLYKASPEFAGLADSTRRERLRFLDLFQDKTAPGSIATLPTAVLSDPRVRRHFFDFRDRFRQTPRKADYALQVLSALLTWSVDRGRITTNVLLGHKGIYKCDRADQIWRPDEIARYEAAAPSPEVAVVIRLACLTGLRRGDLVRLEWAHVGEDAIVLTPNKTSHRTDPKEVVVPLLNDTVTLLQGIREQQDHRWRKMAERAASKGQPIPPRPGTVLTNTRLGRWTTDGLEHQVVDAKKKACIDKHLHDARGTFATHLRSIGLLASEIADILGWEEKRVERLLKRYVDKNAVVRAFAERIRKRERESSGRGS